MTDIQKLLREGNKSPKEIIDQVFTEDNPMQSIIQFGYFVIKISDFEKQYYQLLQAILRQLKRINNEDQIKEITYQISSFIFNIPNEEKDTNLSRRYISLTLLFILVSYYGFNYIIENDTYIYENYIQYQNIECLSECSLQQKMTDLIIKILSYSNQFDMQAEKIKQTRLYNITLDINNINPQDKYTYFELYTILYQLSKDLDQMQQYTQIFTQDMLKQYIQTDLINQPLFKNRKFITAITPQIKPLIHQHLERTYSKSYPSIYQLYVYVNNEINKHDIEVYFNLLIENEINHQYVWCLQNIILHFTEQITVNTNKQKKSQNVCSQQSISQKDKANFELYIGQILSTLLAHYADKIFLKHDVLLSQLFANVINNLPIKKIENINEQIYFYYIIFLILYMKKNDSNYQISMCGQLYNIKQIYEQIITIYEENKDAVDMNNIERIIMIHVKMKKNISFDLLAKSISCFNHQQLKKELILLQQKIQNEDFIIKNYDTLQLLTEFCSTEQLEQLLIWANKSSIVDFTGLTKKYFLSVDQNIQKKEMFYILFLTNIDSHISFTITNTFNYLDIAQLIGSLAFQLNKTIHVNDISNNFKFQNNFELKLRDIQKLFDVLNNPSQYIQDYIAMQCIMPIIIAILFEQMENKKDFMIIMDIFDALFYQLSYFLDFCFQRPDDEMIEHEESIKQSIVNDNYFQQRLIALMPIPKEMRQPLPALTSSILDEADNCCQFIQQQMMSTIKLLVKYLTGNKLTQFAIFNDLVPQHSRIQQELIKFCFKCNIGPTRNKLVLHIFNDTNILLKTKEMEDIFIQLITYILDSAFLQIQRFSARRRTENVQKAFSFMIKCIQQQKRRVFYDRIQQELENINESTDSIKIAQILNFLQVCQDILKWDILITILNNQHIMTHTEYAVSNGVAGILQYYHLFALNRHYIHLTNTQLQKMCVMSCKKADIIRCIVLSKCLFDQNSMKAREIVQKFLKQLISTYTYESGCLTTQDFYLYQNGQFKILADKINKCLQLNN